MAKSQNQPEEKEETLVDYANPKKYVISDVIVTGTQFLDPNTLISITGIKAGDEITIPGDKISAAMNKLWDQGIIGDIKVMIVKKEANKVSLNFVLQERPRLTKYTFFGIKKSEADDLKEKVRLVKGKIVTDALMKNAQNTIRKFFADKGYMNVKVNVLQSKDTSSGNNVILRFQISKGPKVRIAHIEVLGNIAYSDKQVKSKLKNSREKSIIKLNSKSKFIRGSYEEDKKKLIEFYNSQGFRDAVIVSDTVLPNSSSTVSIKLTIDEGKKYFFRNISWTGNYLYDNNVLSQVLGIKKGDVFNRQTLDKRLNYNPNGSDVSSLYLDDGYLFFNIEPVETKIEGDSIDMEMRVYEGPQATINRIILNGNTKTSDHVVLRELRTLPGQKFSRSDLIRSQRELANLGYFDPEQTQVNPKPNPANGTVDIEYTVTEKPSDQIELSGGWGGYYGFVGTLGVTFNNFSAKNIRNFKKWSPLPAGDGQRLSLKVQSNGPSYQSYSFSFSEPWLGGKKPQALTTSITYSKNRSGVSSGLGSSLFSSPTVVAGTGSLQIFSTSVSLGRRIKWPDDWFTLHHALNYSLYDLDNYNFNPQFNTGIANSFTLTNTLSRNSIDNPQFPRKGSSISLAVSLTPPYSLFRKDNAAFAEEPLSSQFKFVEYHKWMFDCSWFMPLPGKLVINTRSHLGFVGRYNSLLPYTPFERFILGGNGLSGFNFLLGSDIIGLRGYANSSIGPNQSQFGGIAYDKFVMEVRYPVSLNPMATIFILGFAEGGNNFLTYQQYNPFDLYRTIGFGARIFMPAFGLIGVDYGFPLDADRPGVQTQPFTFTIGQQLR